MLRFKCYGLRFEWLKLKFNRGFYPREGQYAVVVVVVETTYLAWTWPDLAWPGLTWPDLTWPGLPSPVHGRGWGLLRELLVLPKMAFGGGARARSGSEEVFAGIVVGCFFFYGNSLRHHQKKQIKKQNLN